MALALPAAACSDTPEPEVPVATAIADPAPPTGEPPAPASDAPSSDAPSDAPSGEPSPTSSDLAASSAPAPQEPGAEGLDAPPTETPELLEQEGSGMLFLVGARLAAQDGFDRVVWEYAGEGTPGWRVGYTDDPQQQASGEPVELEGDAALQLFVRSVAWVASDDDPVPVPYDGPRRLSAAGTQAVTEVDVELTFEADQQSFVGVVAERPYRVTLLRDPTRVVLDVAH